MNGTNYLSWNKNQHIPKYFSHDLHKDKAKQSTTDSTSWIVAWTAHQTNRSWCSKYYQLPSLRFLWWWKPRLSLSLCLWDWNPSFILWAILPIICKSACARTLIYAVTVPGLHLKLEMMISMDAWLSITRNTMSAGTSPFVEFTRWRLSSLPMFLSLAVSMLPPTLRITMMVESVRRRPYSLWSITCSPWLTTARMLRQVRSTGLEGTHGEPTGVTMDSSTCQCT